MAGIKRARDFGDFDVYIICISTHAPEDIFLPNIQGLLSIAERLSKEAKRWRSCVYRKYYSKGSIAKSV
ncbi:hypothetical protein DYY65_07315 [Nitrososphaera sp. AFS]|nr:hypothetical protein [Nitrososphaera sp. AFS]